MTVSAFLNNVHNEYLGAMDKFPGNKNNAAALVEEVGELFQTLLQLEHEPHKHRTYQEVYDEAVQIAAMATKIALHGTSEFPSYTFTPRYPADFVPTGQR